MKKPRTPVGYRVMLVAFAITAAIQTVIMLVVLFTSGEYGFPSFSRAGVASRGGETAVHQGAAAK